MNTHNGRIGSGGLCLLAALAYIPHAAASSCGAASGEELQQPPMVNPGSSSLAVELEATTVNRCIGGNTVELKSYIDASTDADDMRPVGPAYVMYLNPSQPVAATLEIEFENNLAASNPTADCSHHGNDVEVCTNLHTHGFHVSPKQPADDVLLQLKPGDDFEYTYELPQGHAPGTHWLHAHLHGSTAPQLREGMAGALILQGDTDAWLALQHSISFANGNDKIMILQQLEKDGAPLCGTDMPTSINGQCAPTITVTEGEVQRWRLIHAGIFASLNVSLVTATNGQVSFYEFARDGINLGSARQENHLLMYPGYRSDVLVQIPYIHDVCGGLKTGEPCELFLLDQETANRFSLRGEGDEPEHVIARVIIESGEAGSDSLPLPHDSHFAKPYPEIEDSELVGEEVEIRFGNLPNPSGGTFKTVNGDVFPEGPSIDLTLEQAQTWKVWVDEDQGESTASHPFHIHVNPFEVIVRDTANEIVDRYWRDTMIISGEDNKGASNAVELRSRYERFDGDYVLHCHNLDHEDAGMMKLVKMSPSE